MQFAQMYTLQTAKTAMNLLLSSYDDKDIMHRKSLMQGKYQNHTLMHHHGLQKTQTNYTMQKKQFM